MATTIGVVGGLTPASAAPAYPWTDLSQPPMTRAQQLLSVLSFDQKVDFALWLKYPYPPADSDRPAFATEYGIPDPRPRDSPNGVFYLPGVTQFPAEQNLASTFDTALAQTYGTTVAQELRGKGFNGWLGPGLDLARNPKWGRLAGNPGEDPLLAGEITSAMVKGAQGQHITTVLKHFAGNLQETGRFGAPAVLSGEGNPGYNAHIPERALQELYYEPFRRAIQDGGATTIMCSYQQINGTPMCESKDRLAVPRTQWGFQGNIIPDFVAAYRNALTAVNAGVDVSGDPPPGVPANLTRDDFVSGRVSAARLDEMLLRTLYSYFASGLFDNPVGAAQDNVSTPESVALARSVAERSTVLLKNSGAVLPLKNSQRIAVIGRAREDAVTIEGGSDFVLPNGPTTTALQAITTRAAGSTVQFSQGSVGDSPLPAIPAGYLTPSSGTGNGLFATYYPNFDWTGTPTATRVESTFDFVGDPLAAPAASAVSPEYPQPDLGNQWSVRYTGTLTPPTSGRYDFSVNPAGNAKVYINGKLIAEGNTEAQTFLGGQPYVYTGAVNLRAGKPVSIRVDYSVSESLFGPAFRLGWQPPSASMIPAAVAAARNADTAVVFVGAGSGEGMDRSTLSLGGDQDALIRAVAEVNPRTVVVLSTPGPVLMPWLSKVRGVIQAGYQGQQFGPAIAGILFGDVNPAGRLVSTYPRDTRQGQATTVDQFPGRIEVVETAVSPNGAYVYQPVYDEGVFIGYRYYHKYRQTPLFPFGYGLSYTSFAYSRLAVSSAAGGDAATASLTVTNTGAVSGDDVVQVYVGQLPTRVETPKRRLAGFARVTVAPGQRKNVRITLDRKAFSYYDVATESWVTPRGSVPVYIGSSADDMRLAGAVQVR